MSKSLTFQSLKDSPSSIEAERAVLGGILIDNESMDKIAGILQVDDFYHELNRKIHIQWYLLIILWLLSPIALSVD